MAKKQTPKTLSFNLRTIRLELGLTQKDMAQRIGISPGSYGSLERNPSQIRMTTIQGIMELGIPPERIFTLT